jgi:DNA ligase-1
MLFELSYDYVGDLSETVALMWPVIPPPQGEGGGRRPPGGVPAAIENSFAPPVRSLTLASTLPLRGRDGTYDPAPARVQSPFLISSMRNAVKSSPR